MERVERNKEMNQMPASNGTGPTGRGPMTGRGLGHCMLQMDPDDQKIASGFAGLNGRPVIVSLQNKERKVTQMPRGDGTGPMGMGPMTGRAAGFCAGYSAPGYMSPVPGRGFGFGRGRGSGFGRGMGLGFRGGRGLIGGYWGAPCAAPAYPYAGALTPYPTPYGAEPTREQETAILKGQAEYFEDALEGIKQRIAEIEAKTEEKK